MQVSLAIYLSPVFFVKKLTRDIKLDVDYENLKIVSKNDSYLTSFIEETLAKRKKTQYFAKLIYNIIFIK